MTTGQIIHAVASDSQTQTVLVLIALDLVMGVLAALKAGTFALTYLANFARNDLLGKAVPFAVIESAAVVTGATSIVVDQIDLTNIAHGMFVLVVGAMVGSILTSLSDLGFDVLPPALAGRRPGA